MAAQAVFQPITLLLLLALAWQAPDLTATGYLIILGLLATLIGRALLMLSSEKLLYIYGGGAFFSAMYFTPSVSPAIWRRRFSSLCR